MTRHTKQDVRRAVERKSGGIRKSRKEVNLRLYLDEKRVGRVTVPKGRGPLHPRTAAKIRDQLKLTRDEFLEFVKCDLTGPGYEHRLREKLAEDVI